MRIILQMCILLGLTAPVCAQAITTTFCSYGNDSEGNESPSFKIGPSGYSDSDTTCGNPMFTDQGEGFVHIDQTCEDGSKVSMDVQISGDDALVTTLDGREHTLKRCD